MEKFVSDQRLRQTCSFLSFIRIVRFCGRYFLDIISTYIKALR